MSLKFNIDRPKASDEEINKQKNFKELVEKFKQQSLKKAQGDESWWKNKKTSYTTIIAGITVVCTITYLSLKTKTSTAKHETLTTQKNISDRKPSEKKAFVVPPSNKLRIPYSSYKINNASGGHVTHASSSKIRVPKNSFVDKTGKDIVGDVTIEYREFHDLGDIVLSGIPMAYDSAGLKFNLQSAGMFDIRGTQNGEPVFIKPDKTIEVELASLDPVDKFNQYYLDTLDKNWKYLKRDQMAMCHKPAQPMAPQKKIASQPNKLENLKREIEVLIPKKIDSVKTIYHAKVEKLPKHKEPSRPSKPSAGRPSFKLDGSYDEFPELAAFNNVLFEVGPENKNYSKELHEITWSDVKISQGPVKGKNYALSLSYRNRTEKLIVYPVLQGDDYNKAEKDYEQKLTTYETLVQKKQNEEKRLLAEMQAKQAAYLQEQKRKEQEYKTEVVKWEANAERAEQANLAAEFNSLSATVKARRLFSVTKFGIYNSDCPLPKTDDKTTVPLFVLTEGKENIIHPDLIYLVDHTNKTVYMFDSSGGFKINYNPGNDYSICLFNRNRMYLCDRATCKKTFGNEEKRFAATPLPDHANNLIEFKKALEIL
jgi:hypothetical protein